jgi:DNA-binding SARP family transcriptional activator
MKYINYTNFLKVSNFKLWAEAIKNLEPVKENHERYYLVSDVIANLERFNLKKLDNYDEKLQKKTIRIAKKIDQIGVDIDIFDNTKK